MARLLQRIRTAISRALARADTLIAIVALFFAGRASSGDSWLWTVLLLVVGLVFLVASGDYSWRKGFANGRRSAGG